MDKLLAMKTFVRIVEAGSFTAAAEHLSVPKGRVSQRLQDLEAALGARLLARTTRALRLTDDGRAYYERCVRLLGEIEEAEQALRGNHMAPRGQLRIDVVAVIARHILAPALPDFHRRYPEVAIQLCSSDRISHLLEDGVDCAIRGGELPDASHVARKACVVFFGLYASPDFLACHGALAEPADLALRPRLGWLAPQGGGPQPLRLTRDGGESVEIAGTPSFTLDDGDAAIAAAVAGAGIVVAAPFAVQALVMSQKLVPVLPEWEAGQRQLSVIYPSSRQLSARVRCFVDWAVDLLRREPSLALRPSDLMRATQR